MNASTTSHAANGTATAAIFGDTAIFAATALAGFPTGLLLTGLNARRLGRAAEARGVGALAAAGYAGGAALAALLGMGFGIFYPLYFALACAAFLVPNLLFALALARQARRDAAGAATTRRDAWRALGIGALAYLATFLIGVGALALFLALPLVIG